MLFLGMSIPQALAVEDFDVQRGYTNWHGPCIRGRKVCAASVTDTYSSNSHYKLEAAANDLEIQDTVTDGNCGLHAFWKSVPALLRASRKRSCPTGAGTAEILAPSGC